MDFFYNIFHWFHFLVQLWFFELSGQRSLNGTTASFLFINPDIPEALAYYHYYVFSSLISSIWLLNIVSFFFLWWFNYLWILSYQLWSAACWGPSASFIVCLMLYCHMKTRLMKIEKQPKRSFVWTHMPLNYCTAYGKQAKHIFSSCTLWSIQVNYKPLQDYGMNNLSRWSSND
jgi:hypothetical protein